MCLKANHDTIGDDQQSHLWLFDFFFYLDRSLTWRNREGRFPRCFPPQQFALVLLNDLYRYAISKHQDHQIMPLNMYIYIYTYIYIHTSDWRDSPTRKTYLWDDELPSLHELRSPWLSTPGSNHLCMVFWSLFSIASEVQFSVND